MKKLGPHSQHLILDEELHGGLDHAPSGFFAQLACPILRCHLREQFSEEANTHARSNPDPGTVRNRDATCCSVTTQLT